MGQYVVPPEAPVLGFSVEGTPVGRIDLDVLTIAPMQLPVMIAQDSTIVAREKLGPPYVPLSCNPPYT
jgi:hypothetical protein